MLIVASIQWKWLEWKVVSVERRTAASVAASAAATAADFGVDEAKDVRHKSSEVSEAQEHYRNANQRVRDTHQSAPECLRRNVAVT